MNAQALASFIWSIAELLRGDYKQSDYGKVILPFTVLRRLDCVLEPTKAAVLAEFERVKTDNLPPEQFLLEKAQQSFFNSSAMDMGMLLGDPANLRSNILGYVNGFSENVRDIFEKFEFDKQIEKLDSANLLFLVIQKFASVDLHPKVVSNDAMGHLFEELIRRFAELSNETAGEHFTPREVIRLMVNLLFIEDGGGLTTSGAVRTIYDPTAGTGGMLSVSEEHLLAMNPKAKLAMHGQELNPESFAICKADMLVKGQDVTNIVFGNTLSNDGHAHKKFDYMLSNPPFGVDWKKVEADVRKEHEDKKFTGRFGPGLPRVSDGSLLFLMHLVSKMRDPRVGGSRIGIVLNGSPLFAGGAGSGESEIRKYLLENDLVEAIVELPEDMFYNTSISTYVWILTNRKSDERKGKVQLIDGSAMWQRMRRNLGNKRKELGTADIAAITTAYGAFQAADLHVVKDKEGRELSRAVVAHGAVGPLAPAEGTVSKRPFSKVLGNLEFGYSAIVIERPLRLAFSLSAQGAEELATLAKGGKTTPADRASLKAVFSTCEVPRTWKGRKQFEQWMSACAESIGISLTAGAMKAAVTVAGKRSQDGELQMSGRGKPEPDVMLRDSENIPLSVSVESFFRNEVLTHFSDAWMEAAKTKVGYEIPFNRFFYVFRTQRTLGEIDAELATLNAEIMSMLTETAK